MIGLDRETGAPMSRLDHIRQSIRVILTTRVGTRIMRRPFGSDLPDIVDRPMNEETRIDLFAATADAIDRWEPRVRFERAEITRAEPGRIEISVDLRDRLDDRAIRLDGILIT